MESMLTYRSIHPIGSSDPRNLPVRDLEAVIPFYVEQLGFLVRERLETPVKSALLVRDEVELVLAENGGHPEQESCYIEVSDVVAARAELDAKHLDISAMLDDEHGSNTYRVFFLRDEVGLCYCIGQKQ